METVWFLNPANGAHHHVVVNSEPYKLLAAMGGYKQVSEAEVRLFLAGEPEAVNATNETEPEAETEVETPAPAKKGGK